MNEDNITRGDVEYKFVGRCYVSDFMPGDLIGGNADNLITKSEQLPNEPEHWVLAWKVLTSGEIVEWNGKALSSDARYVPAQYVIQEAP